MTKRYLPVCLVVLYTCATVQFIRYYAVSTTFYMNVHKYLTGRERLPFQERILPVFFMRPFYRSPWLLNRFTHTKGAFTPERAAFYLISLVSIVVAGIFVQKLYGRVTRSGTLKFLVYPTFLFAVMWTYTIHMEADFSYPYDMPSLAFFSAGLYFIYTRQFLPLLGVILVGTLNRETTFFLIGIYVIDAASKELIRSEANFRERFSLAQVPWVRVLILAGVWLVIKLTLAHLFAQNDASENFVRLRENLGRLKPRLWPALLNVCGYLLPIVLLLRRDLRPLRFRNYLWILPVWFAIMFYTGVILETRIYGELCTYVAIAIVLIIEHHVATASGQQSIPESAEPELRLRQAA